MSKRNVMILNFDEIIENYEWKYLFYDIIPRSRLNEIIETTHYSLKFFNDLINYLTDVLKLSIDNIKREIMKKAPKLNKGFEALIKRAQIEYDLIICSENITFIIECVLEVYDLRHYFKFIIANETLIKGGKLLVVACNSFHNCQCHWCYPPPLMCKSYSLKNYFIYDEYVYVGDGYNDICPASLLLESMTYGKVKIFSRENSPLMLHLEELMKRNPTRSEYIISWNDGFEIISNLGLINWDV